MEELNEFDSNSVSSKLIVSALRKYGSVVLRNVLPKEVLGEAASALVGNASKLSKMLDKDVNDLPFCFADDERSCPIQLSGMTREWYYEGERNFKKWFWMNGDQFDNRVLKLIVRSRLSQIYTYYFEGAAICSYEHLSLRYQSPRIEKLSYGFHQDGNYHSRDPLDHTSLTTWIPFVECGLQAPGLEIVRAKIDKILPIPPASKPPVLMVDDNYVLENYSKELWHPRFYPGDVAIFDGFTVHRTYFSKEMNQERQSADFRVYPKSKLPKFIQNTNTWKFEIQR